MSQDADQFRCRFCHRPAGYDACMCGVDDLLAGDDPALPLYLDASHHAEGPFTGRRRDASRGRGRGP